NKISIYLNEADDDPILTITYFEKSNDSAERLMVDYPNPKQALRLLEHANSEWITLQSEKNTLSAEEKYIRLGKILWHLAIACPLVLGSAGTDEMLYHTLTQQLDLPLLPFKSSASWDIYAMF